MQKLEKLSGFKPREGPVTLCIIDGAGYAKKREGSAFELAETPNLDWLHANCVKSKLKAHGLAVGLPSDGDMGNSEVGHNAMGCGRVFAQGAKLVNNAVESKRLFEGDVWKENVAFVKENGGKMHFIGLFSDGNVHSHLYNQLQPMIDRCAEDGVKNVRVHTLLDGRDVGERSALEYIVPFEEYLAKHNEKGLDFKIASGGGRMYITMDRYGANWKMVHRGWNTHVHGLGRKFPSAVNAIETYRKETNCIDQDMHEFVICDGETPVGKIEDGDAVVFFNFRGDRAMEISQTFDQGSEFAHFDRGVVPKVKYAGIMQYDGDLGIPKRYLVVPPSIDRTVGEYLANSGVRQLAVSETQKYGHVTYFFNGNRLDKFDEKTETYVCVPSDVVPFEERPWMKGAEITDEIIKGIESGKHDFIRLNYPNGDMVGHTGVMRAAIIAMEVVDLCLGRLMEATKKANGVLVVTADHGNCDEMYETNKKGEFNVDKKSGRFVAKTSHTLSPVPFLVYDPSFKEGDYTLAEDVPERRLSNLSATCINLLGYKTPEGYDPSLLNFKK